MWVAGVYTQKVSCKTPQIRKKSAFFLLEGHMEKNVMPGPRFFIKVGSQGRIIMYRPQPLLETVFAATANIPVKAIDDPRRACPG